MKHLILTRSVEENQRLSPLILEMGFNPISIPMISKQANIFHINEYSSFEYIIITSKFAAQIVASALSFEAKILVVGEESANILASNKFAQIFQVYENVSEIIEDIDSPEKFIYFHGNNITQNLPVRMVQIYFVEYFTGIIPKVPSLDNILIFSEMSAEYFILFIKKHNLLQEFKKSVVICISPKVAKKFSNLSENLYFATKPNEKEMLELLKEYGRK
jgi:uroporphyrinogen-III synthase